MSLRLYSNLGSPAARSVLLTIRALGIKEKVQIVPVDLLNFEHHKEEYVAKNPLGTVPLLEDGDFTVWDSHAINGYLVNEYGQNDSLYPKNPRERALVDAMCHFDSGYLFVRANNIRLFLTNKDPGKADLQQMRDGVEEVYGLLDAILQRRQFVAGGNHVTIADFGIAATLSTIEVFVPLNDNYPNITKWFDKIKALPYYDINQKGVEIFKNVFGGLMCKL